jgi:hypothetical protein
MVYQFRAALKKSTPAVWKNGGHVIFLKLTKDERRKPTNDEWKEEQMIFMIQSM